jgi:6-pyruvoyltetrahydropterin/6-carboxytetrahydropterin synthase
VISEGIVVYTVAVRRDFIAQHFLIGGDWGLENELHSHQYLVELQLHGDDLDSHGYLLDIVEIETQLDQVVNRFRDHTLNEQPEFVDINPSLEHFARIIAQILSSNIGAPNVHSLTVQLWENPSAWASYHLLRLG